jgi:excisionase family DNA binding protein
MNQGFEKMAYSIAETAKLISVSARTVHKLIKKGDLVPSDLGERVLITPDEIKALLERKKRKS